MMNKRRNFNLPEPECNRTGTGNLFNLIMRMTVLWFSVMDYVYAHPAVRFCLKRGFTY